MIRGVREPRKVEVVLEATKDNELVEVKIGMIAVVNSQMIRELQRQGVQIDEFSINAFRNEFAEVENGTSPLYTSHLSWSLKYPKDDESYQDLIKHVRVYRND